MLDAKSVEELGKGISASKLVYRIAISQKIPLRNRDDK